MKILNVCYSDWANFMYDNYMALKSIGADVNACKTAPHEFGYIKECDIVTLAEMKDRINAADVIQIFFSNDQILKLIPEGKRVFVWHAGSEYRAKPVLYNKLFNHRIEKTMIALPEFANKGATNETYIVGAYDTKNVKPVYNDFDKPKFRHYPSSAEVKGTKEINGMMSQFTDINYSYSESKVTHPQQIERIKECDIYIELYKPNLRGKPYGAWGITTLEAAALGKIIVTQNINDHVYKENYGEHPLFLAESKEHFVHIIRGLSQLHKDDLRRLQKETRQWVVKNHSYESTGKRVFRELQGEA